MNPFAGSTPTFAQINALLAAANASIAVNSQALTGVASISLGTSVASAGDVRATSTFAVKALRNGGGGDISVLTIDGADGIVVGGAANTASVTLNAKTGGFHAMQVNSVESVRWDSTQQLSTVPNLHFAAGAGAVTIDQNQATSGAGVTTTHKAQRGFAGSAGGIFKIGGGAGGTSASDLPGDTQIDLGTAVANVSAKASFLVGGATILDINQSAASTAKITAAAKLTIALPANNLLTLQATTLKLMDASSNLLFDVGTTGGTNPHAITTSQDFIWINGKSQAPTIFQNNNVAASGAGQALTIQAQTATGTNSTGGDLILTSGTGTSTNGTTKVQAGAVTRIQAGSTGIALFGGTERAQPSRAGQATDNSGGTSGAPTIASVAAASVDTSAAGLASTRNAIATLAAMYNTLEAKISAAGTGIGVTA